MLEKIECCLSEGHFSSNSLSDDKPLNMGRAVSCRCHLNTYTDMKLGRLTRGLKGTKADYPEDQNEAK